MDHSTPSRLQLLEAVARKAEQDLVRQRQLLEDLRFDGHRTTEAEAALQKLEAAYSSVLAKLEALREAQAEIKPADALRRNGDGNRLVS